MKLNKKHKELIKGLIKGKGYFKTPRVRKDVNDKMLDVLLPLYMKGVLIFQREYNVPFIGPANEHKVTHKHYVITTQIDTKNLRKMLKHGEVND